MSDKLLFSDFASHPLLKTEAISHVIPDFPQYMNANDPLAAYLPYKEVNADKITIDIDAAERGGMTPAVAQGSSSPIYSSFGQNQIEWTAAEWREKVRLEENELIDLRKIGTLDQTETWQVRLRKKYDQILARLRNRVSWMRHQVLFDGQVVAPVWDSRSNTFGQLVVPYSHPSHLEFSPTTSWDDPAATPLDDLQFWAEDYMLSTGYQLFRVHTPLGTMRLLSMNSAFRDIAKNSFGAFNGTPEQSLDLLQMYVGVQGVGVVSEEHGRIQMKTTLMADAAAIATTVTLYDVSELVAGDELLFRSIDMKTNVRRFVSSVNATTRVVTLTAALGTALEAGTSVAYFKFLIPRDKLLMVGRPQDGTMMMDGASGDNYDGSLITSWADICSVYSRYKDLTPKPGLSTKLIDHIDDGDPPFIEQVLCLRALPRVHYNDGWATATHIF